MKLRVDIWADVVCPWCFIGKRRFEQAIARFEHPVEIAWRAFELDPNARRREEPTVAYLATKYRVAEAQAQAMIDRVVELGQAEGIGFRYDLMHGGNSFDAHRLLALAGERGVQGELMERVMIGYFTSGLAIDDRDALVPVAVGASLEAAEVKAVLDSARYGDAVRADEQLAAELGITGVPCFVIDRHLGVSGAQPVDTLLEALHRGYGQGISRTGVIS